ncbi:MAG: SurA N-terminal domain-containing protein [Ilumatobacteraceae bacterium]
MSVRTPLIALAVTCLALAACSDGDDSDTGSTATNGDPAPTDPAPGDDAPTTGDEPAGNGDEPPTGVAASVGETEIAVDTVEGLYEEIASSEMVAQQLEQDDSGAFEPRLRAQVLSQLVVQEIIEDAAAADFGIEVTDADLQTSLDDLESETEGTGGLDATLEASGMTRETFERLELPLLALLDELEAEFGDLQPDPGADPGTPPEGQAELQAWGTENFAAADVVVASEYGTWDPATGQVQPASVPDAPEPDEDGDGVD